MGAATCLTGSAASERRVRPGHQLGSSFSATRRIRTGIGN
jgi:hypothetical protein